MFPEGDFVGPDYPADEHHGERIETHKRAIDGPLRLHDAGVEDHEAGDGLQAHEGGCGHLPGIVAFVQPVGVDDCRHDGWCFAIRRLLAVRRKKERLAVQLL